MSKLNNLVNKMCPNGVPFLTLDKVATIKNGKDYKHLSSGNIPVYGTGGVMTYVSEKAHNGPSVLIPRKGSLDKIYYVDGPFWNVDTIFCTDINQAIMVPKFFYYFMCNAHVEKLNKAGGVPSLTQSELNRIKVPVPPKEIQVEIVRILDNLNGANSLNNLLNQELELRKTQYEYYLHKILSLDGIAYKTMTIGEIGSVKMCKRVMKHQTSVSGVIPFYKIGTFGGVADSFISKELFNELKQKYSYPKKGNVLISCSGTIGRTVIFDGEPAYFQDSNIVWVEHDATKVIDKYLYYVYKLKPFIISTGGTISRLYNDGILSAKIKVPSLEEQKRIINILDRFDVICNNISDGIPAEIEARQKQYEYYRDKLLTFKELRD